MKILIKPITILTSTLAIIALLLVGQSSAQTSSQASFSLNPSDGSISRNGTEIEILVNSGDNPINVVSLSLEYDQTKLEFVRFDGSESNFEFPAPAEPSGNGVVNIVRGTAVQGGLTQINQLGKVVFKAIGESGDTTLRYGDNSSIIEIGPTDIWNGENNAGTFKIVNGTTEQPVEETSDTGRSTENSENLVAIKVTDTNNQPVVNKVVKIGERTSVTDNTGIASFGGLTADTYTAQVVEENGDIVAETEFSITDDVSPTVVQQFEVQVEEKQNNLPVIIFITTIILLIILLLFLIKRRIIRIPGVFNKQSVNKFPYDNGTIDSNSVSNSIPSSGQVIRPSDTDYN